MTPSSKKNKRPKKLLNKLIDSAFIIANKIIDMVSKKHIIIIVSFVISIVVLFGTYCVYEVTKEKTRALNIKILPSKYKKVKLYPLVSIGYQKWMSKNLDTDHYRNGDPIPYVKDPKEWSKLKTGAWCYYKNNKGNDKKFGKLYNWYAVNDVRGLAPKGFHIPTEDEWTQLSEFLGEKAGFKLKAKNAWINNGNGNNESGFSALSSGYRYADASRFAYGYTCWWSSTESIDVEHAWYRYVGFDIDGLGKAYNYKGYGLSVRCIKDNDQ